MIASTKHLLHRALLCFAAVFALFTAPCWSATINVPSTTTPTIQSGIDAASDGDTVLVAPGTYFENIDFKGKAITVTSSSGAAATIIDGGGKIGFAAVTFANSETRASVISKMTIRNGGAAVPGSFIQNSGGVFTYLSAPSILNNIITANFCNGVVDYESAPLIQGNTISSTIGAFAGSCRLEKGAAIEQLGGDYLLTDGSVTTITGNTVENNTDGIYGTTGGIDFFGGDGSIVKGNIIRYNTGTNAGAISSVNLNTLSILQNLVYGNSAGGAGAFNLEPPESSVGPFTGIIAGNTIADNTVTYGKTYSGDTISSQIFIGGDLAQWLFVNNIIVGNVAGTTAINCDVGYDYLTVTPLVFDHNDVYAADGVAYAGSCPDQTGTYGNINADPRFISPSTGNYQLSANSPALDAGNNSAPFITAADLLGKGRIQDATAKGYPVVDMGAYELTGKIPLPSTTLTLTPAAYYYPDGGTNLGPFDQTPVNFTLTLASAASIPSGPVTIYQDGSAIATVNVGPTGVATYDGANVTPGLHAFTSQYAGSQDFSPAVSVKFYLFVPATKSTATVTALTSSKNPSAPGETVTFTATVTSGAVVPTGSIAFTDGTVSLGTQALSNGTATLLTSTLATGSHTIGAAYTPDVSSFSASTASLTQTVQQILTPTTPLIGVSPSPSISGQSVTFTVAVTSPDPNFIPTSVTLSDSETGQSFATLTPVAGGFATFSTSTLPGGYQFIYANYFGDATHAASFAYTEQDVANTAVTTTTLTSSLNPAPVGQPVTFTAAVTLSDGTMPEGVETFYDSNGVLLGTQALVNGVATATTSNLAHGAHSITANFTPTNSIYTLSEVVLIQVVTGSASATATSLTVAPTTAVYGTNVVMTSTVNFFGSPNSTGGITFMDGSIAIITGELLNGSVTSSYNYPYLTVGTHIITAVYSGDATHDPSTSPAVTVTITAAPSTLALSAAPNPAYTVQPITLTARLAGGPAGGAAGSPISFSANGNILGSAATDSQGTATLTVNLLAGTYSVTATFAGSTGLAAATSAPVTEVVNLSLTATAVYAQANPGYQGGNETLVANITSLFSSSTGAPVVPSGTVTFIDSGTPIATANLDATGHATFSTTAFAVGDHLITAAYNGSTSFTASTSAAYSLAILPRDFILTADPTITIQTEHHKSLALTISSVGDFADTVALSCGPMPAYASCAFPGNVPLVAAGSIVPATISINTDAIYDYLASSDPAESSSTHPHIRSGIAFAFLLPLPLIAMMHRRRTLRRAISLFASLTILLVAMTVTGCSGHYPGHTPPGTYAFTITAAGAATHITHTATVNLVVTE